MQWKNVLACLSAWIALFGISQTALADETVNYAYDALGRLVTVSTSGTVNNGQNVTTGFDPAGNRTNYTVNGANGSGPAPSVSVGNAVAAEGGVLAFQISMTSSSTSAVSVNYSTSNGTALAGSDYTAASGSATIAAGQTSATVNIGTIDDTTTEASETMSVSISSPTAGAVLGNAVGTGTINDNDTAWTSSLTAGTYDSYHGYLHGLVGSMTNTSFNGYTIDYLWDYNSSQVTFILSGASVPPNSGWTSITVPGVGTLTRASANYIPDVYSSGTASGWIWYVSGTVVSGTVTIQ